MKHFMYSVYLLFIRYDQSVSSELTFQIRSRCKLIIGSDTLSLSKSDENSVDDDHFLVQFCV